MDPQSAALDGTVLAPARPVVPGPRVKAARRPVPERTPEHAHLSLVDLRAYRTSLAAEESKVSYWRRIIQARLDVVRAGHRGAGTATMDAAQLRPVLSDERVTRSRSALMEVVQVDDIPPMPDLAELWDRRVGATDEAGLDALEADLAVAETQLSSYRTALHGRIAAATAELIARYREKPTLCLSALPLGPPGRDV
jgi:hypothetical protein